MLNHLHRIVFCAVVAIQLSALPTTTIAQDSETPVLELGKAIERELVGEQAHRYVISVNAGDYLHIIAEQRGVDVVVILFAPDGTKLKEVDSPNGTQGPEPVLLIAEKAGAYRLEVRSLEKASAGKYTVTLTEKRTSTTEDRDTLVKKVLIDEAQDLTNQVTALFQKGRYKEAIPLAQRSLTLRESALGPEHPDVAQSLNDLAGMYFSQGDYVRAVPLYQRSLVVWEKTLGPEHSYVGSALNNLGVLYKTIGDYDRAKPLLQRALVIREKALGKEDPLVAESLNNLAGLYRATGEYALAGPLFQRALAIREKVLGPEHSLVAESLNNLAGLYRAIGDYVNATPLLKRALGMREKALGPDHPYVAQSLSNLANVLMENGDYASAELFFQRSLAIYEKVLGPDHPNVATVLGALAALFRDSGDNAKAIRFLERANEVRETNIVALLSTGSQQQKQVYLDSLTGESDSTLSFHIQNAPGNADAARLAVTTILRRKGRVLDAFTSQLELLRKRAAPEDRKLLDDLVAVQTNLSNLRLGSTRLAPDARRAEVARLTVEQERLEDSISRRSSEFRAATQPITWERVHNAVPVDAVLVEVFVYLPVNAKAKIISDRFGKARYVAYLVSAKDAVPQFVDLGEASPIDLDIAKFRAALQSAETPLAQVKKLGRSLDERIMRPVRKLLGKTKRVFLAPDGALNLVPFAALVNEKGRYLVEEYDFNYLTSGRDLLRLQIAGESKEAAAILANPYFDLKNPIASVVDGSRVIGMLGAGETSSARSRSTDFTDLYYPPLPGTGAEATSIGALLPNARVWTQGEATEARLKAVNRPSILHIATHGFFFADQSQAESRGGRQLVKSTSASAGLQQENPMLRSGLILAGVKQKQSGEGEDGVLTAQEAAGVNLFGTKLVVLSACETGLGDVQNGAGVYGLRRALVLAGSETQVMSLWKVSDTATRDLMIAYYTLLQSGAGRVSAIRQVQLAMLRGRVLARTTRKVGTKSSAIIPRAEWRHPYYWAAFIPSGSWTTLDGKEPKTPG